MFDIEGVFGAYAFNEENKNRIVEALISAYHNGFDLNDSTTLSMACEVANVDLNTLTSDDLDDISSVIVRRISS